MPGGAYYATKSQEVTVLHVVRDIDGEVYTGSATGFSVTLYDPSRNDDSSLATWTEPCTTGYLDITFTPDETGNWLMEVTNPSGTNEATVAYTIQAFSTAAGVTGTYLTTRAKIKEALGIGHSDEDDYIDNLLARASYLVESRLGRTVNQASYTEYLDGTGHEWLDLRQGPVSSVHTVSTVTWDNGSATTASVSADTYIVYGDEDDWLLPGRLRMDGGSWYKGRKNYEVQYTAGWATVPYDIEEACVEAAVWLYNQRKDQGRQSRDVGSGSIGYRSMRELFELIEHWLAPYRDWR